MALLKFDDPSEKPRTDWIIPTMRYGGTGIVRPHAFAIFPALHVDVLHRDGWERENPTRVTVEIETDVRDGDPAFVRVKPSGVFTRVGSFRADDHAGTCIRMPGFALERSSLAPYTRYPVARLSQIDRRVGWYRHASGDFLTLERAASGRYDSRPPTNRKRKRERCKARRRGRQTPPPPRWRTVKARRPAVSGHDVHGLFDAIDSVSRRYRRTSDYSFKAGDHVRVGDVEVVLRAGDFIDITRATAQELACVLFTEGADCTVVKDVDGFSRIEPRPQRPVTS